MAESEPEVPIRSVMRIVYNKLGMPCFLDQNHFGLSYAQGVFSRADYNELAKCAELLVAAQMPDYVKSDCITESEMRECKMQLTASDSSHVDPVPLLAEHTSQFFSDVEHRSQQSLHASRLRHACRRRNKRMTKTATNFHRVGKLSRYTNNAANLAQTFLMGGLGVHTCACFWHGRNPAACSVTPVITEVPISNLPAAQFATRRLKQYVAVRTHAERLVTRVTACSHVACDGKTIPDVVMAAILRFDELSPQAEVCKSARARMGIRFAHLIEYLIPQVAFLLTFVSHLWPQWHAQPTHTSLMQLRDYHAQSMAVLCIILHLCAVMRNTPHWRRTFCRVTHIRRTVLKGICVHNSIIKFIHDSIGPHVSSTSNE